MGLLSAARWTLAPHVICALMLGVYGDLWWATALLVMVVLPQGWTLRRFSLDRLAQLAMLLTGITASVVITTQLFPETREVGPREIGPIWTFVALSAVFMAVPRLWLDQPLGGQRATAALALLAVMACGGSARTGPELGLGVSAYLVFIGCWAVAQLVALMVDDAAWVEWFHRGRRVARLLTVVALAVLMTVPVAMALPVLHEMAIRTFRNALTDTRSGFDDYSRLGSLHGMLQSDTIVLRVYAQRKPDHLRGVVYNRYRNGDWMAPPRPVPGETTADAPRTEADVELLIVGGADRRYFVPLGARRVGVPAGQVAATTDGLIAPWVGDPTALWYQEGARDPGFEVAPPDAADLEVPPRLQLPLRLLAAEWTAGLTQPGDKLRVIADRLREDYEYSLEFDRTEGRDPVLEFLLDDRSGHCEYFASAMTLLARTVGVPARMVGGYRVMERNRIGGYWVVRERNAHAWTEVWEPGAGWQTMDATAAGSLPMPQETPWLSALVDAFGEWLRTTWAAITSADPVVLTVLGLLLGLLWLAVRRWRARPKPAAAGAFRAPLPSLAVLMRAIAGRGEERPAHEPLEHFAARLTAESGLGGLEGRVAGVLRDYAAYRYGGVGDVASIEAQMEDCARTLEKAVV